MLYKYELCIMQHAVCITQYSYALQYAVNSMHLALGTGHYPQCTVQCNIQCANDNLHYAILYALRIAMVSMQDPIYSY